MECQSVILDAVTERLQKLEKQSLRLKRATTVLGAAVICFLLMGVSTEDSHVIEAQKFVVKDDSGKVRAALMMGANGPTLAMYDDERA
jgi:hypothetical protein